MLYAPRMMTVGLAMILGMMLFGWARVALGREAALVATAAYAFCPVLLAYGHIANVDMAGALGWVLAYGFAWRWHRTPTVPNAAWAGLAMGLALCLKYSTLLVLPALAGTFCYERLCTSPQKIETPRKAALQFILAFLAGNAVMMLSYRGWGLPEWLAGFSKLVVFFQEGHLNYFWGRYSQTGWRTYFITAFFLKTPLPFLAIGFSGIFVWERLEAKSRSFLLGWCLWPAALIFAVSSFSSIQVGIRHILPVFPFLCLWVGAMAVGLWNTTQKTVRGAVLFLGLWYIAGTAYAFPRYISYFNEIVGPSASGYRYLVDSNLDWGQGLQSLGADLLKRGSPTIYLSYFGCADPALYGIHYQPVLMATCSPLEGRTVLPRRVRRNTSQSPSPIASGSTSNRMTRLLG